MVFLLYRLRYDRLVLQTKSPAALKKANGLRSFPSSFALHKFYAVVNRDATNGINGHLHIGYIDQSIYICWARWLTGSDRTA